jgi:hypothetical protein
MNPTRPQLVPIRRPTSTAADCCTAPPRLRGHLHIAVTTVRTLFPPTSKKSQTIFSPFSLAPRGHSEWLGDVSSLTSHCQAQTIKPFGIRKHRAVPLNCGSVLKAPSHPLPKEFLALTTKVASWRALAHHVVISMG